MLMQLLRPRTEHLPSFISALERGWSPNNLRPEAAREELEEVRKDPRLYLELQDDLRAKGPPITLPSGRTVPRLPGLQRWMRDGEFCGAIGFRWQPGTNELPPHCLGHIGYSVVLWKQGRGYATETLRQLLPQLSFAGLSYVEITTDLDNVASQRVIPANGGYLVGRFTTGPEFGRIEKLRFRINL